MVDKRILDDALKQALDGERLQDNFKEVQDQFGAHAQEIQESVKRQEEHGKTNKLLNFLQVGEIAMNLQRDKEAAEGAQQVENFQKGQLKHNVGAKESRSRIEGGIKDIKDMLGEEDPPNKSTNAAKLGNIFQRMAGGGGVGESRRQLDANNMLQSFASSASGDPGKLAEVIAGAEKEERRELMSALNKISDVAAGSKRSDDIDLAAQRKILENNPTLAKAGIAVNTDKSSSTDMLNANAGDAKTITDRKDAFKEFRNMAQEQRLLVPAKGSARSGVDIETMPEKNYEVLVDIYELLERWHNQMLDGTIGNEGDGGSNFVAAGGRGPRGGTNPRRPRGRAVRTPNPAQGFKHGGQGRVQAKSGRWYSPSSTQGKAIIAAKTAPKTAAPTAGSVANVADDAAKGGNKIMQGMKAVGRNVGKAAGALAIPISAILEGFDAKADMEVAEERAGLGEDDEAFLATSDKEGFFGLEALTDEGHNVTKEKAWEVGEATSRVASGTVGAMGGAKLGATTGAAIGTFIGGPVGTVAGGIIGGVAGGVAGYVAGSEVGEAVTGVAKAWSDDDLQAAQDSGLYDWEGWGNSILDRSKLADASSAQLQAIVRHNDLSDDDMNAVLEELHKRGGATSLNANQKEEMGLTDGDLGPELEATTTPTADAVGNTTEGLEDATAAATETGGVSVEDNSTKITKIEKGEPFAVDTRLSSTDSSQESALMTLSRAGAWTL